MPNKSKMIVAPQVISSTIQTILSAPEFHRLSPAVAGVADYHRRSGIPCRYCRPGHPAPKNRFFIPDERIFIFGGKCIVFWI